MVIALWGGLMSARDDGVSVPAPGLATDKLVASLDALPEEVYVFEAHRDPDGTFVQMRYVLVNEAARGRIGRPVEQIIGRGMTELLPSLRQTGCWDSYMGVFASGSATSFDLPWPRPDGVAGVFRVYVCRVGDGIVASWHDITEQVRAQREQAADRANLHATLDSLLDPHVMLEAVRDETGQIVDFVYSEANPAACVHNALDYQDLVGSRLLDLLSGATSTRLLDRLRQVVETGGPLVLDDVAHALERPGGPERRYDARATRVGDGVSYTWRDITDSHLAERRLRAAHDSMIDPHVLYEAIRDERGQVIDFRFVDVNTAACEYNKWPRERLIGSTLGDQWPDFVNDPTLTAYARVLATGAPLVLDDVAWAQERLFSGQVRHYDLRAAKVTDSLLSVTWRDITERHEAAEHDQYMAAVVEQSHDAIVGVTCPDAIVTSWNPAAEKMYGYTAEEMVGRESGFLLAPKDQLEGAKELMTRLQSGEHVVDFETVRLRKDGTLVQVSMNSWPIRDANGLVVGLSTIHRDITRELQAKEAVAEQQAREQARLEELERFQAMTVGRELKMIELKKEIEYLRKSGAAASQETGDTAET